MIILSLGFVLKVSLEPLGNRKDKFGRRSLIYEANFLTKKEHRVWDRVHSFNVCPQSRQGGFCASSMRFLV